MATQDKQIVVAGQFVSERVHQVVQAIKEYCPEIEVQWIPPGARSADEAAFRLVHFPPGGEPYTIFHVKTEDEFDARVLKKLIMGDQRAGQLKMYEIEAAEEAAKRVAHQRFIDQMEEANEIAHSVFKSNKDTYRIDKHRTIKENVPGIQVTKPKVL